MAARPENDAHRINPVLSLAHGLLDRLDRTLLFRHFSLFPYLVSETNYVSETSYGRNKPCHLNSKHWADHWLLYTATTITTREPLAPASKSPAIAVQAVKPSRRWPKGWLTVRRPNCLHGWQHQVVRQRQARQRSAPTSAPASSTSTTSSVSEVTKGEEDDKHRGIKAQAPLPWRVPPRCNRKGQPEQEPQAGAATSRPARMKRRWQVIVRLVRWQEFVSSSAASDEQAPSSNTAAVSQPSGSRSTEASVTSAATSSSPVVVVVSNRKCC